MVISLVEFVVRHADVMPVNAGQSCVAAGWANPRMGAKLAGDPEVNHDRRHPHATAVTARPATCLRDHARRPTGTGLAAGRAGVVPRGGGRAAVQHRADTAKGPGRRARPATGRRLCRLPRLRPTGWCRPRPWRRSRNPDELLRSVTTNSAPDRNVFPAKEDQVGVAIVASAARRISASSPSPSSAAARTPSSLHRSGPSSAVTVVGTTRSSTSAGTSGTRS